MFDGHDYREPIALRIAPYLDDARTCRGGRRGPVLDFVTAAIPHEAEIRDAVEGGKYGRGRFRVEYVNATTGRVRRAFAVMCNRARSSDGGATRTSVVDDAARGARCQPEGAWGLSAGAAAFADLRAEVARLAQTVADLRNTVEGMARTHRDDAESVVAQQGAIDALRMQLERERANARSACTRAEDAEAAARRLREQLAAREHEAERAAAQAEGRASALEQRLRASEDVTRDLESSVTTRSWIAVGGYASAILLLYQWLRATNRLDAVTSALGIRPGGLVETIATALHGMADAAATHEGSKLATSSAPNPGPPAGPEAMPGPER